MHVLDDFSQVSKSADILGWYLMIIRIFSKRSAQDLSVVFHSTKVLEEYIEIVIMSIDQYANAL